MSILNKPSLHAGDANTNMIALDYWNLEHLRNDIHEVLLFQLLTVIGGLVFAPRPDMVVFHKTDLEVFLILLLLHLLYYTI